MVKTEFFKHSFNLSEGQIKSITDAIKNKIPITLKLSKKTFHEGSKQSLDETKFQQIDLPLTKSDTTHIINNKGFMYSFNKTKIKMMKIKENEGGFFPIPLILGALGKLLFHLLIIPYVKSLKIQIRLNN